MNKHEYSALWRLVLAGMFGIYLCRELFFADRSIARDGWEDVRGTLNALLVIALLLDAYLRRRKGISEDERDRVISGIAARNALVALGILVFTTPIIVAGGVRPDSTELVLEVAWFDFYVLACITFAIWMEAAVTVFHHWRDRR